MLRLSLLFVAFLFPFQIIAAPPKATITGPTGGVPGDIILLDGSATEADHYQWTVIPATVGGRQVLMPIEGGRRSILASLPDILFTVVFSASNKDGLDVLVYTVKISGTGKPDIVPGPTPNPQPQPNPQPGPMFPNSPLGLSQAIFNAAQSVPKAGTDAAQLGNAFRGITAQIAAGTLVGKAQILAELQKANKQAIGVGARFDEWAPVLKVTMAKELAALAQAGKLGTDAQIKDAFLEIAIGLEAVK